MAKCCTFNLVPSTNCHNKSDYAQLLAKEFHKCIKEIITASDSEMEVHGGSSNKDKWVSLVNSLFREFGEDFFQVFNISKRCPMRDLVVDTQDVPWCNVSEVTQSHNVQTLSHSVLLACMSKHELGNATQRKAALKASLLIQCTV